jgi:TonB family protein
MTSKARFWRYVTLIGLAHTIVITGLTRWSRENHNTSAQSIVWMSGGGSDGGATLKTTAAAPASAAPSRMDLPADALKQPASEEDRPLLTSATSDIQLPSPKPSPSSVGTAKPGASPKVKVTPKPPRKPKPKPTATQTPKPSPRKLVLAKVSPKASASPAENKEEDTSAKEDAGKKTPASPIGNAEPQTSVTKSAVSGAGAGHASGGSNESQFGWYGSMLHDRFYSEWVQPSNVATTDAKNSVLAKLRIEKDGRISRFEIIKPSGNTAVDESVAVVSKRVTQVDPLPPGLGDGEHYDVKINFELSSE